MSSTKKKKSSKNRDIIQEIKAILGFLFFAYAIWYFSTKIYHRQMAIKYLTADNGVIRATAIVTPEKNHSGNGAGNFSYSYEFSINGESYIGNSFSHNYQIGDTIHIDYYVNDPSYNSPHNYYER